uniref:Ubiquitin carboxyl-terminal hydrolase n=1 Tax=Psilocybe cubensis TaxID=181762 RepID=A0A8H8CF76_PSICU
MSPIDVHIKHNGKTYDIKLDPDLPPAVFKDTIYSLTGVPVDRMKVMVKGGVLKGQTFMVIGAAGELPKAPPKPIVFLEDMDDSELAEALAKPVGLTNLGNTCYMNATVQALRAVPELQAALEAPSLQSDTPLPGALRDLYRNMAQTADTVTPFKFLQVLRETNRQFAEMDRSEKRAGDLMMGRQVYAQQDAEECYGAIVHSLRNLPGLNAQGKTTATGAEASVNRSKFVEQYFMGKLRRELKCKEEGAENEPPTVSTENVLKIECNISIKTNFMLSGIMSSLDTELEKNSPSLNRTAVYTQTSRLTRLPTYLTVHMVRFAWRADISKKAKIMRQVKFPQEFDALDIVTKDLQEKLLPASRKMKEIEKDRRERRKVRARTKQLAAGSAPAPAPASGPSSSSSSATPAPASGDVEMADASAAAGAEEGKGKETAVRDGELEDESVYRKREAEELAQLINEDIKNDIGASTTGLYELVAIVTHKGAAADAGHYMGYVKKSVFNAYTKKKKVEAAPAPSESAEGAAPAQPSEAELTAELDAQEGDEDWYKFDDDKVSVFPQEKLATLDGGGEDSSAYVLLYRSKNAA